MDPTRVHNQRSDFSFDYELLAIINDNTPKFGSLYDTKASDELGDLIAMQTISYNYWLSIIKNAGVLFLGIFHKNTVQRYKGNLISTLLTSVRSSLVSS